MKFSSSFSSSSSSSSSSKQDFADDDDIAVLLGRLRNDRRPVLVFLDQLSDLFSLHDADLSQKILTQVKEMLVGDWTDVLQVVLVDSMLTLPLLMKKELQSRAEIRFSR